MSIQQSMCKEQNFGSWDREKNRSCNITFQLILFTKKKNNHERETTVTQKYIVCKINKN